MPDTPLIEAARQWVIDKYPYNSHHLLKALEWLDRIAPDASEAMRLATLTHDMERAFPGPDQPVLEKIDGGRIEAAYNVLHSERSARFVGEWLREQKADETFVEEVEKLIKVHEVGGWAEANLVQAADSLSFLETNIDLFLNMEQSGKRSLEEVLVKFVTTLDRIQVPAARAQAIPLYQQAGERLQQHIMAPESKREEAGMDLYFAKWYLAGGLSLPAEITAANLQAIFHDLRGPFSLIVSSAEVMELVLRSEPVELSELMDMVKIVKLNGVRAGKLIEWFAILSHRPRLHSQQIENAS
jgi:hypothetical protein